MSNIPNTRSIKCVFSQLFGFTDFYSVKRDSFGQVDQPYELTSRAASFFHCALIIQQAILSGPHWHHVGGRCFT